jgi:Rrf2 family protein
MVSLSEKHNNSTVSSRILSEENEVSYDLTCKLLQKLAGAKLVKSKMGTKGGFALAKDPSEIALLDIIKVVQGPLCVNSCMMSFDICSRRSGCPISDRLEGLQRYIEDFFEGITLDQLLVTKAKKV